MGLVILILFFINSLYINLYSQSCPNLIIQNNVVTINDDTINILSLGDKQLIIFVQSPGCHNCYIQLNNVLVKILNNYKKEFMVNLIIRCENNILSRNYIKDYILDLIKPDNLFYDIHKRKIVDDKYGINEGFFGRFKVLHTPTLLFINNKKMKLYDYRDIFGKKFSNVEEKLESYIIKELIND